MRAAQGEVNVRTTGVMPSYPPVQPVDGKYIIGHSESGHHHVIDQASATVVEHPSPPEGVRILFAELGIPNRLVQDAATPHDQIDLPEGIYEFRISREYNPFSEQARQVAD